MSILVVHLVPEGLLFAADWNITVTRKAGGFMLRGQTQRPKVLKWPNREAIIGYVGEGRVSGTPTNDWLYDFIGRNITFTDFDALADALTNDLDAEMAAGGITGDLTLHLDGFELVGNEWTPRIWFIRNTTGLTAQGPILGQSFARSEEIAQPTYFGAKSGNAIRADVRAMVQGGGLFSFRQGIDLAAFNAIDSGLRAAMQAIVQGHPLQIHQLDLRGRPAARSDGAAYRRDGRTRCSAASGSPCASRATPRSARARFSRGSPAPRASLSFSPHAPRELAITSRSSDRSPTDRPAPRTFRPAAIFLAM